MATRGFWGGRKSVAFRWIVEVAGEVQSKVPGLDLRRVRSRARAPLSFDQVG